MKSSTLSSPSSTSLSYVCETISPISNFRPISLSYLGDLKPSHTTTSLNDDDSPCPVIDVFALPKLSRVLSTFPVAALCYFVVSGGPIGSEGIFAAGGPLIGLLSLAAIPFLWCIPIALVTAELSTAFPENGGFAVWTHQAFGPFWGFQVGYWAWISGVINVAAYPVLAVNCLSSIYVPSISPQSDAESLTLFQWSIRAGVVLAFTLPNFLGAKRLGQVMLAMFIVVLVPFLVFSIWGFLEADDWAILSQIKHANTTESSVADGSYLKQPILIDWSSLLGYLFWNCCNGFANVSTFAGEVANPGQTYPRALSYALVAVILTYMIPLASSAVFNSPNWSGWSSGSFQEVAKQLGGAKLQAVIAIVYVVSNWGLYCSNLFCTTYVMAGMAELQLVPNILAARNAKSNVPTVSLVLVVLIQFVLVGLRFDDIVAATNVLSALAQVCLMATTIRLRTTQPDAARPYCAPRDLATVVAMCVSPTILCGFLMYFAFASGFYPAIVCGIVIGVGIMWALMAKFDMSSNVTQSHRKWSRVELP